MVTTNRIDHCIQLAHKSISGYTHCSSESWVVRLWIGGGVVDNSFKQMSVLYWQQLFFSFLDTMANVIDCDYGKSNSWY